MTGVDRAIAKLVLSGVAGLGCWLAYQTSLRYGRTLLRIEELEREIKRKKRAARKRSVSTRAERSLETERVPPGISSLPDFELTDLSGERVTLSQFRGWRVLLIFLDLSCAHSREMLPELAVLQSELGFDAPIPLLVTTGSREENLRLLELHGIRWPVALQEGREVAVLYGIHETPAGYLIDEQGYALSPRAVGAEKLLTLARFGYERPARQAVRRSNGHQSDSPERRTDAGHGLNAQLADASTIPVDWSAPPFAGGGPAGDARSANASDTD